MTTVTIEVLNLTQHQATAAQITAGVYSDHQIAAIAELTNFVGMPTEEEIKERAGIITHRLLKLVKSWEDDHLEEKDSYYRNWSFNGETDWRTGDNGRGRVMVGGAPWFMSALCVSLKERGFNPVFSFTERQSIDEPQGDGSVKKVSVFNHVGFIPYVV